MIFQQFARNAAKSSSLVCDKKISIGDLLDLIEHQSDMLDALVVQFFEMKKERDKLASQVNQLLEDKLLGKFGVQNYKDRV